MLATRFRLSSLPPAGGVAATVIVAVALASTPVGIIEMLIVESGLPAMLPASSPPLGPTARSAMSLLGGVGAGLVAWAALFLLFGPGGTFARDEGVYDLTEIHRADAHHDVPSRRYFDAADLDTPPPATEPARFIERDLPRDLDQLLADFDPDSIPDRPREPVRTISQVRPRPAPLAPGERISSVEIAPRHASEPGAPSIEMLFARLGDPIRRAAAAPQA